MTAIRVSLSEPTTAGRLKASYDKESGILVAESTVQRPWDYGIDIDGVVVFDMDASRLVAAIDVHVPRRLWAHAERCWRPARARKRDLRICKSSIEQKSLSMPIVVCGIGDNRQVLALLGRGLSEWNEHAQQEGVFEVELSSSCTAFVCADALVGIWFSLA